MTFGKPVRALLVCLSLAVGCGSETAQVPAATAPRAAATEPPEVGSTATEGPDDASGESHASRPGAPQPRQAEPAPPPFDPPAAVDVLDAGAAFTCLLRDGRVRCWGSNRFGQLGDPALDTGRGAFSARAVEVTGLVDVRRLALGSFHACATDAAGRVLCWGHGGFHQLGGEATDRSTPTVVPGVERASLVAAGEHHSCALAGGEVLCWGDDTFGQLGVAEAEGFGPVRVPGLGAAELAARGEGAVVALAAGRASTCALLSSGVVDCWGEDLGGQLGAGERTLPRGFRTAAQRVDVEGATALEVGWGHACVLVAGVPHCWGRDDAGQLGTGQGGAQASHSAAPRAVELTEVVGVAAGGFHTCFLLASGDARCVGANHNGQLGDGGHGARRRPVPVAHLGPSRALAAGESHTCALLESGSVRCWGNPHSGRVGPHADERARRQTEPVVVIPAPHPAANDTEAHHEALP